MNIITKELTLDVARENLFQPIVAKQYDVSSRFLKVRLANEGSPLAVDKSASVIINAERADMERKSFAGEVNDDGTVTVPIANWMLELDDYVRCDVSVIDPTTQSKLTSTSFSVQVELAANGDDEISDEPEYNILVQLIGECGAAKSDCGAATLQANSAAQAANQAANAASNAATAANQSKQNADTAANGANAAATAANNASAAASTAKANADAATAAANSAADAANAVVQEHFDLAFFINERGGLSVKILKEGYENADII